MLGIVALEMLSCLPVASQRASEGTRRAGEGFVGMTPNTVNTIRVIAINNIGIQRESGKRSGRDGGTPSGSSWLFAPEQTPDPKGRPFAFRLVLRQLAFLPF